jgi:hypothetical protein
MNRWGSFLERSNRSTPAHANRQPCPLSEAVGPMEGCTTSRSYPAEKII